MIIILENMHNKLSIIQYLNKESQIKCTMKEEGRQHKKAGINSVFCAFYFYFSAD